MKKIKSGTPVLWTKEDTEFFIDFGNYFVPERALQFRIICDLIPNSQKENHILDLCCGEGLLAAEILRKFPECVVYGYDGSDEMLRNASVRSRKFKSRFKPKLIDLASSDWRDKNLRLTAIVSSLAIHHLDPGQKQVLFKDVFEMLDIGGVFLVADLIKPVNEPGWKLAARLWDKTVHQRAVEVDDNPGVFEKFNKNKWNYFRFPDPADRPSTLFEQLKWLEEAGFVEIDVYWMKAGHAVFGGRKL